MRRWRYPEAGASMALKTLVIVGCLLALAATVPMASAASVSAAGADSCLGNFVDEEGQAVGSFIANQQVSPLIDDSSAD